MYFFDLQRLREPLRAAEAQVERVDHGQSVQPQDEVRQEQEQPQFGHGGGVG